MEKVGQRRLKCIQQLDSFGVPVQFNFGLADQKGENYRSRSGGFLSLLMLVIILVFFGNEIVGLVDKQGAVVSQYTEVEYFDKEESFKLKDEGIKVAIGLSHPSNSTIDSLLDQYFTLQMFLKKVIKANEDEKGFRGAVRKQIDLYPCTEDDFAQFDPIRKSMMHVFERDKHKLMCFDDSQIILKGNEYTEIFSTIEILVEVNPELCLGRKTEGLTDQLTSDDFHEYYEQCTMSRENENLFKGTQFMTLTNNGRFDSEKFTTN